MAFDLFSQLCYAKQTPLRDLPHLFLAVGVFFCICVRRFQNSAEGEHVDATELVCFRLCDSLCLLLFLLVVRSSVFVVVSVVWVAFFWEQWQLQPRPQLLTTQGRTTRTRTRTRGRTAAETTGSWKASSQPQRAKCATEIGERRLQRAREGSYFEKNTRWWDELERHGERRVAQRRPPRSLSQPLWGQSMVSCGAQCVQGEVVDFVDLQLVVSRTGKPRSFSSCISLAQLSQSVRAVTCITREAAAKVPHVGVHDGPHSDQPMQRKQQDASCASRQRPNWPPICRRLVKYWISVFRQISRTPDRKENQVCVGWRRLQLVPSLQTAPRNRLSPLVHRSHLPLVILQMAKETQLFPVRDGHLYHSISARGVVCSTVFRRPRRAQGRDALDISHVALGSALQKQRKHGWS